MRNYIIRGVAQNITIAANSSGLVNIPSSAAAFYISSTQRVKVSLDGTGVANIDFGLVIPIDTTAIFVCKSDSNSPISGVTVYNTAGAEAKVTIQFLREII